MRILCPIVQAFVGAVLDTWHDLLLCSVVGAKLVGDQHPFRSTLALHQLAHQTFGCLGVAATLHENVQDETVLIDGAPKPILLAAERNDGFIEMLFIAEPAGRTPTDLVGEGASEFLCPHPDRLMRDDNPSCC